VCQLVSSKEVQYAIRAFVGDTEGLRNLLFSSQSFVTKLANTLSACVLVIGDVSAFTSRSAAREEMEYELFGASMICSTWSERSTELYNTVRVLYVPVL
jgi:hypothetical protein